MPSRVFGADTRKLEVLIPACKGGEERVRERQMDRMLDRMCWGPSVLDPALSHRGSLCLIPSVEASVRTHTTQAQLPPH